MLAAAYSSIKRLQEFLRFEERPDLAERANIHDAGEKFGDEKIEEAHTGIQMTSASFSWTPDGDAYLQDVSINLNKPLLYICVGSVASVSMLLSLVLLTVA